MPRQRMFSLSIQAAPGSGSSASPVTTPDTTLFNALINALLRLPHQIIAILNFEAEAFLISPFSLLLLKRCFAIDSPPDKIKPPPTRPLAVIKLRLVKFFSFILYSFKIHGNSNIMYNCKTHSKSTIQIEKSIFHALQMYGYFFVYTIFLH
jgi:hypothetical protein